MAKLLFPWLILGAWLAVTAAEDKWVWSGSGRSAKLSKGPGGRYGVFEETIDIPDEPYSPLVRPPPSNLPPLVRPTSDGRPLDRPYDVRPRPPTGLGAYYNRPGAIGSDRLPVPGGFDRPYDRPNNGFNNNAFNNNGFNNAFNNNGFNNRYPNGPNQSFRPPLPPSKPGLVDHEDADPTKFDKCKCTHSFNCKSPGIVFGSCDVGKKYCCEKNIHHSNGIPLAGDGPIPEVLAGPGGPVDHLKHQPGVNPNRGNNYSAGQIEPRRP